MGPGAALDVGDGLPPIVDSLRTYKHAYLLLLKPALLEPLGERLGLWKKGEEAGSL